MVYHLLSTVHDILEGMAAYYLLVMDDYHRAEYTTAHLLLRAIRAHPQELIEVLHPQLCG